MEKILEGKEDGGDSKERRDTFEEEDGAGESKEEEEDKDEEDNWDVSEANVFKIYIFLSLIEIRYCIFVRVTEPLQGLEAELGTEFDNLLEEDSSQSEEEEDSGAADEGTFGRFLAGIANPKEEFPEDDSTTRDVSISRISLQLRTIWSIDCLVSNLFSSDAIHLSRTSVLRS